jgi:hypothetical protein
MSEYKGNGFLLECPNCFRYGKKQVLGRLLDNGDLLVLRFHHGTTLIRTPDFSLICGCGYVFNISGTVIEHQFLEA